MGKVKLNVEQRTVQCYNTPIAVDAAWSLDRLIEGHGQKKSGTRSD